ncbi:chemotaxis protein CheA [Alishewanella tabrizica]|uniref:Chemotaxis protein CheA n=1 Tax=Alishewanella tabrizica TaxID=671278 RepID=A0ABQ2WJH8_9ALTE|nr:chemotaxis protein CheA [Alishewanella tabrizica]GGW57005.1 chemotaxis protein CheA [Alishewanella tabrizica]
MLNMQELVSIFLTEGRELTDFLEQELLAVEHAPSALNDETINAMFRAAHTIKGSAGVVGLHDVVAFTHLVETAFESVRAKQLQLNTPLINILLRCNDHIVLLFNYAENQQDVPVSSIDAGQQLLTELAQFLTPNASQLTPLQAMGSAAIPIIDDTAATLLQTQHIYIQFGPDTFRDGFDPIAMLRFIAKECRIVAEYWYCPISPLAPMSQVTDFNVFEHCYLCLDLVVTAGHDALFAEAFEYIKADSVVHFFAPESSVAVYQQFLASLPSEEANRLQQRWLQLGLWPITTSESTCETLSSENEMPANVTVQNASALRAEEMIETPSVQTKAASKDLRLMRVPAFRLDEMVNQLGELVIATATLQSLMQEQTNSSLAETVEHIQQLVDDIQSSALQLRMVQIGETFNRFNRVVRDIATTLGKNVRLEIEGADTELDKSMVERISDPLMHLVRNAMDHGLELPDERAAAGKASQGLLALSAYHDSGSIVIEIRDDGRGINRKKVLSKAIEKGIVSKTAELSDIEIDELIFAAGFSTADEVSNLSGRGVGMDVVRKNIEALRGTVHIFSVPGQGTTFQLRLPLTLAIIDGFMVRVADSKFVIPLNLVTECIELPASSADATTASFMHLRGEMLPFIFLEQLFQLTRIEQARRSIIVVRYGQYKAGLVVDQVLGEFQTVIKPLGKLFEFMQGISGSSILGSGDIALILDIPKLINKQTDKNTLAPAKHEVTK